MLAYEAVLLTPLPVGSGRSLVEFGVLVAEHEPDVVGVAVLLTDQQMLLPVFNREPALRFDKERAVALLRRKSGWLRTAPARRSRSFPARSRLRDRHLRSGGKRHPLIPTCSPAESGAASAFRNCKPVPPRLLGRYHSPLQSRLPPLRTLRPTEPSESSMICTSKLERDANRPPAVYG